MVRVSTMHATRFMEIPGYEGRYAVSNHGEVWSFFSNRYIKLSKARNGYMRATLWDHGIGTHFLVHRLVAEAYVPNRSGFSQVNHIDGNKTNNESTNLEWCDASMNMRHAYDNGLIHVRTTRVAQCNSDGEVVKVWDSIKEAAKALGVNHANISTICKGNGTRRLCGGYTWRYM